MAKSGGLNFYRRKKVISAGLIKDIFSWIFGIVLAVFLAAILNYFMGMSTYVVGSSMEPTLFNGQQIFINRLGYSVSKPKTDDIVVFLPNGNRNAHYYVKRVVGVPGDKIQISEGKIYINGEVSDLIPGKILEAGIVANELTLQKNEYFCIGDNPSGSEDSRSADIGPVHVEDIIGKVWFAIADEEGRTGFVK